MPDNACTASYTAALDCMDSLRCCRYSAKCTAWTGNAGPSCLASAQVFHLWYAPRYFIDVESALLLAEQWPVETVPGASTLGPRDPSAEARYLQTSHLFQQLLLHRKAKPKTRKEPITADMLKAMVESVESDPSLTEVRLLAMCLIAFQCWIFEV